MLTSLTVRNFKSIRDATLPLAGLTVLIGANASGKSNVLEALGLLCGMAGGRRLSDLTSDASLDYRGGVTDLTHRQDEEQKISFVATFQATGLDKARWKRPDKLKLTLDLLLDERGELRVAYEQLDWPQLQTTVSLYWVDEPADDLGADIIVRYNNFARGGKKPWLTCLDQQPVFTQLVSPARFGAKHKVSRRHIPRATQFIQRSLGGVLFLDPVPRLMREYSFKTDRRLRSDGRNLSAALYEIVHVEGMKEEVLAFVRDLPEQNIDDIDFIRTTRGEVMVQLKESFGGEHLLCDAALLSDGTLRVLAIAAALWSVPEGSMVVIEELDNGVHPSRAASLLDRISRVAEQRSIRVLLTTHNPALLDGVPNAALPSVVACYRDPKDGSTKLRRLSDLQSYPRLVSSGPLGRLVTEGTLDRLLKSHVTDEERDAQKARFIAGLRTAK